jgi:hypothetical protein
MSEDTALSSLLALYGEADCDVKRRGREWYDAARRECRKIARATGVPYKRVAAVLAITSPDAQLSTNLRWTREICEGSSATMAGRYPRDQRPKVEAALRSDDPGQYATGPKVSAFYRAIVGDADCLVIDRWASFAAGGPRDKVPGVKIRRMIEAAYRRAADLTDETVRDFQAIVWIQSRETTVRSNGQLVRLADITA